MHRVARVSEPTPARGSAHAVVLDLHQWRHLRLGYLCPPASLCVHHLQCGRQAVVWISFDHHLEGYKVRAIGANMGVSEGCEAERREAEYSITEKIRNEHQRLCSFIVRLKAPTHLRACSP